MRLKATLLVLAMLVPCAAQAAVWYVDKSNTGGPWDGTSWATAFQNVNQAARAAKEDGGGEVWVAAGVYDENRYDPAPGDYQNLQGAVQVRAAVHLYGGFAGDETAREERDPAANVTVLDGATARDGQPAYHTVRTGDSTTVDGFTVRNGQASGSGGGQFGGGLYILPVATTQVANCLFEDNSATAGGGSYLDVGSTATFNNCQFVDNAGNNSGGGLWAEVGASVSLVDCEFTGNAAAYAAGLGLAPTAFAEVNRCAFRSNTAQEHGGAIYNLNGDISIVNSVFYGNTADAGGAILNDASATLGIVNSTFYGNNATDNDPAGTQDAIEEGVGGAVYAVIVTESPATPAPVIHNSILWGDGPDEIYTYYYTPRSGKQLLSPVVTFSNVEGGYAGEGNINADPRFIAPATGNLRLQAASPCRDSAAAVSAPEVDIEGAARPQGAGFDMGAYEYQFSVYDINRSGKVDAVDVQLVINAALGFEVAFDCDVNGGGVTASDIQLVINAALGIIE